MSTPTAPLNNDFAIAVLGAQNGAAACKAANARNVALYNSNLTAGHPSDIPDLLIFDQQLYINLSMQQSANPGAVLDWSQVITTIPYVPVTPPPAPPSKPEYTIGLESSLPNCFTVTVSTNNHNDLLAGIKLDANNTTNANGHTFTLIQVGFGGMETLAQMTS